MMSIYDNELVYVARRAAHAAASVHRAHHEAGLRVSTKSEHGDIVTQVDRQSEAAALEVVAAARPNDSARGEEGIAVTTGSTAIRWIIDPLDGTTNYALGMPYYCASVAAFDIERDQVVAAAIEAEALGVSYWAGRSLGAFRQLYGQMEHRLDRPARRDLPTILLTGLSYDPQIRAGQLGDLPQLSRPFDDIRALGSAALELCLVADRTAEMYVETDLYEYDWAAGALIAQEAGATVRTVAEQRGPVSAWWD
ncbi:MAG: inositol monophosphatase [Propionibacteriaceae bacterium]|jgi:myo-inositol-1(or 4)-monophosphatase|nr:inositol monophosphatase [Propionibacteriaceae bacterium]